MTKLKHELVRDARVKVYKLLEEKLKECEETAHDILDDVAAELGYVDVEDESDAAQNFDAYLDLENEIINAAYRQLGGSLFPDGVYALLAFSPKAGIHLEFFSERPHTDGEPENWPTWFRVYEGNIDGGDSLLVDERGASI